jgi:hypothetical protein
MFNSPLFLGFFLFAALALPVSAANVNVVVVETGVSGAENTTTGAFEASSLWENSFLDVFFEAGHIVSNSPVLRLGHLGAKDFPGRESPNKEFPPELDIELEDAVAGGAEFFIIALLAYPPGAVDRRAKPEQVSLRIYTTRPYGFVYEGSSSLGAQAQPETEAERAKRLIRGLIPHLKDEV